MLIVAAIEERRLIAFRYHGQERVVEPHIYGLDRHGHAALSGYQIRGGSESGGGLGWRMFHFAEMEELRELPRRFHRPRPGYNPDDDSFRRVYAKLPAAERAADAQ
jgi:hypothetical protein